MDSPQRAAGAAQGAGGHATPAWEVDGKESTGPWSAFHRRSAAVAAGARRGMHGRPLSVGAAQRSCWVPHPGPQTRLLSATQTHKQSIYPSSTLRGPSVLGTPHSPALSSTKPASIAATAARGGDMALCVMACKLSRVHEFNRRPRPARSPARCCWGSLESCCSGARSSPQRGAHSLLSGGRGGSPRGWDRRCRRASVCGTCRGSHAAPGFTLCDACRARQCVRAWRAARNMRRPGCAALSAANWEQ